MIIHLEIKNHIKNKKVSYKKSHTKNISVHLKQIKERLIPFFILESFQESIKVF